MNTSDTRFLINTYLLRGEEAQAYQYIDLSTFTHQTDLRLDASTTGTLYYGSTSSTPDWLAVLSKFANSPLRGMESSSVSGIITAGIRNRLFVITFGHAWQKIKQFGIESNFGIRCVLNIAMKDSLRAIRRDRIAEDSIQAIEQIPDNDDIYRFGIDIERDLLRGVKAKIEKSHNFGTLVAGGDSFRATIDLESESIANFLHRCMNLYKKEDYKKDFPWVDNIFPIKDDNLRHHLTSLLADLVIRKDSNISLCIPDLLNWDDHDFFSFARKKGRQAPCAHHLELGHWVEHMSAEGKQIDINALMGNFIYAYRQGQSNYEKWPIFRCLHGLVCHEERSFLAHSGNWFELDSSFVESINKRISSIPTSKIPLPKALLQEKEGDYNLRVADASCGSLLLMDKNLIMHGGGKSRFEVCDLLSEDGHLICVKPWGGASGTLSHLFFQAINSIRLINNDKEYRDKVRARISDSNKNFEATWDYVCANPDQAEVVLATIRGCRKESLPFFAKLSLVDCVTELKRMRFNVSYAHIELA